MQRSPFKIFVLSLMSMLWSCTSFSFDFQKTLQRADSFMLVNEPTKALSAYQECLDDTDIPDISLLKKAALSANLIDEPITELYFLNSLYKVQPNELIEVRIQEIAAELDLKGYDSQSQWGNFLEVYDLIRGWLIFGLVLICSTLFIILLWQTLKQPSSSTSLAYALAVTLTFLFVNFNFKPDLTYAFVTKESFLFKQATPAAQTITKTKPGDSFLISDDLGGWLKVEHNEEPAFLRKEWIKVY